MKQNKYLCLAFLLASQILSCQKCEKEYTAIPPKYDFVEKLTLTPYKKIYSINDTIWIQFQAVNKTLYDKLSNSLISMDTSSVSVRFLYHKRYIIGNQPEYFCEINADNRLNPAFNTLYTFYNELNIKTSCNDQFSFKVGFIPKKTGIYSLEPRLIVDYCPTKIVRDFLTSKFVFDLADCNKDIWFSIPEQSRRSTDPDYEPSLIDKKEIFVFKVE